jgi:hypothetical protein
MSPDLKISGEKRAKPTNGILLGSMPISPEIARFSGKKWSGKSPEFFWLKRVGTLSKEMGMI